MSFFKNVNPNVHRWRHIAIRKNNIWTLWDKFSQKTFYFAYLLTKRENFSHLEAKFICWFSLCMKWAWQANMVTPFFKIWKKAHHIISRPISRLCDPFHIIWGNWGGRGTSTLKCMWILGWLWSLLLIISVTVF